jgi:hypothetical protein
MTSCGGIVCVIVRRVTRTMRSATGMSSTRRALLGNQAAEAKHHTPLVLAQHAH